MKKIKEMERVEERLSVFSVDTLDYHSILVALKGCSALFCCLDCPDGYDVSQDQIPLFLLRWLEFINVVHMGGRI